MAFDSVNRGKMRTSLQLAATEESTNRLAVQQLALTRFRNYDNLRASPGTDSVVLTGPNGSGKTNLLEAISLLSPGRGLRKASILEIQKNNSPDAWAISAEVFSRNNCIRIGTGREPSLDPCSNEVERRVVHIDGKPAKNQQSLAEHTIVLWITPDMDRVLAEGPSARRKLLDRLVYNFDPSHSGRVQRYEKALRERLFLLRENKGDAVWLSVLEDTLAQTGVAIAAARKQMLRQLQIAMTKTASVFPQADLELQGMAEKLLDELPALLVEDRLRAELALARAEDAEHGNSHVGPHRSDLLVTHKAKQCPADSCSTGEQKALLIAIMIAFTRTIIEERNVAPIFLLDDITAHLDDTRRRTLFEEIEAMNVQAWMSGTDPASFNGFLDSAQHYEINHGVIVE